MEQVDARKVLAKAFELFDLYPQVGTEDLPSVSVSTGNPGRGRKLLQDNEPVDNIYFINRNHLGNTKYTVTREDSASNKRDYINNVNDFLKIIKDSPIISVMLDVNEDLSFHLFDCQDNYCPEVKQWATKTAQKHFRKSGRYIRWDENPYTLYRRGEFYKDSITGEPITPKERAAVDRMASNLMVNKKWKMNFGKTNGNDKDIKYLKTL
jgi:hypothetical protein